MSTVKQKPNETKPLILVENLRKQYTPDGPWIIDDINLTVNAGDIIAIIGESGCGKSTLLRTLAGLETATDGTVELASENVAMVFQYSALFDWLTVLENVAFSLLEPAKGKPKYKNADDPELRKLVAEKLEMVGLEDIEDKYPNELSGGMQKRVSFARAVISNPSIILYDEPTSGLDPVSTAMLEDYIQALQQKLNAASVVVTHTISTVRRVATRVLMLHEGHIHFEGTPDDLFKSTDERVKAFVQAAGG
ncbi:MAG: ATP-binding cassette domain-containing protein [Vampirovibrionales bacterium]|nr:ATP-binding cassette domain-containing protein [Vampirovibrionales bacterium]